MSWNEARANWRQPQQSLTKPQSGIEEPNTACSNLEQLFIKQESNFVTNMKADHIKIFPIN